MCQIDGCRAPGTTGTPNLCVKHKFSGGLRVNGIQLFRSDREHGVTQAQKAREMFSASKADGKDITRVPGRRTPTEVHTGSGWEKVG